MSSRSQQLNKSYVCHPIKWYYMDGETGQKACMRNASSIQNEIEREHNPHLWLCKMHLKDFDSVLSPPLEPVRSLDADNNENDDDSVISHQENTRNANANNNLMHFARTNYASMLLSNDRTPFGPPSSINNTMLTVWAVRCTVFDWHVCCFHREWRFRRCECEWTFIIIIFVARDALCMTPSSPSLPQTGSYVLLFCKCNVPALCAFRAVTIFLIREWNNENSGDDWNCNVQWPAVAHRYQLVLVLVCALSLSYH